jgi:hypothetical protein
MQSVKIKVLHMDCNKYKINNKYKCNNNSISTRHNMEEASVKNKAFMQRINMEELI